jgi:predicted glutamine amidotransferase
MAYKGTPILIDELLYQPKNSLINQSTNAKEIEEPLNGDGFGIGWYSKELSPEPATFVSVSPAWNNRNLRNLAPRIKTDCLVAHVRAASVGEVSESNCHPFQYKNLLMAHNGGVENFNLIKRKLREPLSNELYNWIKGQTDSEHIFAYFINYLQNNHQKVTSDSVADSLENTYRFLTSIMLEVGIKEAAFLNMVVTDGEFMVGTRYVSNATEEALTLYHSEGNRYVVEDGVTRLEAPEDDDHAVLIVSEKLTDGKEWTLIPKNYLVMVEANQNVRIRPMKV